MNIQSRLLIAAIVMLLLVAIPFVGFWLWSLAGSLDSRNEREGLMGQLMQRKSDAAIQIRDSIARGKLRHAERGVSQLRQISETSHWFLPVEAYSALSNDFRSALDSLDRALSERNSAESQKAYTRLIKSCVGCHQQTTESPIDSGLFRPNGDRPANEIDADAPVGEA